MNTAVGYVENATKTVKTVKENDHFDSLFPYIINGDKTIEQQLVSGYQISDVYHANEEFLWTKQVALLAKGTDLTLSKQDGQLKLDAHDFEKNNATLAHHLIQSFSPDDNLSPEEIHEIGRKTVLELTGGNHEFVIATHVDKEHIHNHIVFNSTNLITGNAFRWQKNTKRQFEQISDKYASQVGAKIIEKSPSTTHAKYTIWQTENIYRNKIKQRLDFLIDHSSKMDDFLEKAKALELSVDFSGKWATYKLTDQPQIKNTRSRSLSKSDPERYNFNRIKERLSKNKTAFSVDDVVSHYIEKTDDQKMDYDYKVTLDAWQIHHATNKGYYVDVDFGIANHGQIFIGAYKMDKLENGSYDLYLKKSDFFYFMNEKDSGRSRYMDGRTLMRQLSSYNGTVPIKKEPIITTINDLVDAINFLAEHDVTDHSQLKNLEDKLLVAVDEAQLSLDKIDQKLLELSQISKHLLALKSENEAEVSTAKTELEKMKVKPDLRFEDVRLEIQSEKVGRQLLKQKLDDTIEDFNLYNGIKKVGQDKQEKAEVEERKYKSL